MQRLLVTLGSALLFTSCAPSGGLIGGTKSKYLAAFRQPQQQGQKTELSHTKGYWDGDNVTGPASIRIIRTEQKAYFYKGSQVVGMSPVATGKTTHTTPPGRFKISEKDIDHKSSLYGVIRDTTTGQVINNDADSRKDKPGAGQVFDGAPMPYFMRFNSGIGMHVGHLPGYAASHGCVRMPEPMAAKFYENAEIGTPVIVE